MFITMSRKSMINVRLAEATHEDFKIVAELRGASMSTLLHQFIVKAIREEKEISPQAFQKVPRKDQYALDNAQVFAKAAIRPPEIVKDKKKKAA